MLMGCFYNTPNIILCILYNIRCTSLVYWDNYINYRRGFLSLLVLDWMGNARSLKT